MNELPLAHRRIVMTRAENQLEGLRQRLQELGADPIPLALIKIVEASDGGSALRGALARMATFDWLVVTSPNGALRVTATTQALTESRPRIAVVGTATAEAMAIPVDLVPHRQIAEGLIAEFPEGTGTLLLAQAQGARSTMADGLADRGWQVEVVAAYRTVACTPTIEERTNALTADAVLFASGSAVRAWVDVFGTAAPPPVIVLGPATAEVADRLGLKVAAIGADHSLDGLVKCVMAYFLEHG